MTDRNDQAKQEFALAQARAAFARAVSAGQTGVYDRFGALLAVGDSLIYISPPTGYIWQIKDVGPDLRPGVQAGVMKVTLVCEVTLPMLAGEQRPDMMRIIRADGAVAPVVGGEGESDALPPPPPPVVTDMLADGVPAAAQNETEDPDDGPA